MRGVTSFLNQGGSDRKTIQEIAAEHVPVHPIPGAIERR